MGSLAGLRRGASGLNSGKGGSKRSSYFARWKPPHMDSQILGYLTPDETRGIQIAEPIVFVKSDYIDPYQTHDENNQPLPAPIHQPVLRVRMHTVPTTIQPKGQAAFQKFVDIVCSAGIDQHAPQPCLGCYLTDHGEDVSAKDQWVIDIVHLGWYHEMPFLRDGQIQMKKDGKGPVLVRNECQNYRMLNQAYQRMDAHLKGKPQARECDGCKQSAPFVWGDHRLIQVGKNHINNFLAFNDELGKTCFNCRTGIITVAYACSKCNSELLDVGKSGWTNAQIEQFSKTVTQCQTCGTADRPVPIYECGYDLRTMQNVDGGCPEHITPRPIDIFDVVVWVQREGESTQSEMVFKSWTLIQDFRMPDGRMSGTPDGKPLIDVLGTIAPKPFDLKAMYSPTTVDEQAKTLRRQNPFAASGPQYQAYGQQPQQGGPQTGYAPPGYAPPGYAPQGPPQGGPPPGSYIPPGTPPPPAQGWGPQQQPAQGQQWQQPPQQPPQGQWGPQQQGAAPVYPPTPPGATRPNFGH